MGALTGTRGPGGGRKKRLKAGEYKPCPTWGCRNGKIRVGRSGERIAHKLCGGDGYIYVGKKPTGGRPPKGPSKPQGRRRPRGRARSRRKGSRGKKALGWFAGCGVFIATGEAYLGTIGQVFAIVVVLVVTVLKVLSLLATTTTR